MHAQILQCQDPQFNWRKQITEALDMRESKSGALWALKWCVTITLRESGIE